jgi:hypothetical protein
VVPTVPGSWSYLPREGRKIGLDQEGSILSGEVRHPSDYEREVKLTRVAGTLGLVGSQELVQEVAEVAQYCTCLGLGDRSQNPSGSKQSKNGIG